MKNIVRETPWRRIIGTTIILLSFYSTSTVLLIRDDHIAMAAALTGVSTPPTSNIVTTKVSYEILFTTATTGTIKTVVIKFPSFNVGSALLIERSGIGPGTLAASTSPADTLTYTVTSPVSIPGGTPVRFELANIIHPLFVSTFPISITTKDTLGNAIDGPTAGSSSIVPIGNLAIANQAVTFSKISPGAVSVTVQQVRGATVDLPPNNSESAAVATCPPGSVATGGGFSANAGLQVLFSAGLVSSPPPPTLTAWDVVALNPTGSTLAFSPFVDCITVHP